MPNEALYEFYQQSGPGLELTPAHKAALCSPGWAYKPGKQELHRMSCKRRLCEKCGQYWAWKWRKALEEKEKYGDFLRQKPPRLALTLTTAEKVSYKTAYACFRYFWQFMRRGFPNLKYWGTVEVNQSHTLPHFHFVLDGYEFIEFEYIRYCWQEAQRWAKIENVAWVLRVERIKKNIAAYFTKYITKLKGGKDEIPTHNDWQGRYLRYSQSNSKKGVKGFFPAPVAAMAEYAKFSKAIEAEEQLDRIYYHVRKPIAALSGFMDKASKEAEKTDWLVNRKWEPTREKLGASALSPPAILEFPLAPRPYSRPFEEFYNLTESLTPGLFAIGIALTNGKYSLTI